VTNFVAPRGTARRTPSDARARRDDDVDRIARHRARDGGRFAQEARRVLCRVGGIGGECEEKAEREENIGDDGCERRHGCDEWWVEVCTDRCRARARGWGVEDEWFSVEERAGGERRRRVDDGWDGWDDDDEQRRRHSRRRGERTDDYGDS